MAGGAEPEALAHELERGSGDVGDVGRELLEDTETLG